jgi:hypothetical protein
MGGAAGAASVPCNPHPTDPFPPHLGQYEDGVLELTIAKKAAQQAKTEGRTIAVE